MPASQSTLIISSASFYLKRVVSECFSNQLDTDDICAILRQDGNDSLYLPSADLRDTSAVARELNKICPREIRKRVDLQTISQAYIDAQDKAKREGRYFGRNPREIKDNFQGDEMHALSALSSFLEHHGYRITIERNIAPHLLRIATLRNELQPIYPGKDRGGMYDFDVFRGNLRSGQEIK